MSGYDDEAFCEKCLGLLTATRVVEMPGGEGLYAIESALVRGMCSYFHWLPRILDFK